MSIVVVHERGSVVLVPAALRTLFRIVLLFSRRNSVNGGSQLLRVISREYPELALSFNAVCCKICMINGRLNWVPVGATQTVAMAQTVDHGNQFRAKL